MDVDQVRGFLAEALEKGSRVNKKYLNSVAAKLQESIATNPEGVVDALVDVFCKADSRLASTMLLTCISDAVSDIGVVKISPIKRMLFETIDDKEKFSVAVTYNAVTLLPRSCLNSEEAGHVLSKLVDLLPNLRENSSFVACVAHATNKWSACLGERRSFVKIFLRILSENEFGLSALTLICQCAVHLVQLDLGKEAQSAMDAALSGRESKMDQYSPAGSYVDFVKSMPLAARMRLETVMFEACSGDGIEREKDRIRCLSSLFECSVSSDVDIACLLLFVEMILQVLLKLDSADEQTLKVCFDSMVRCPASKDAGNRKLVRSCVSLFLKLSVKFASLKFAEYMFSVLVESETFSQFKQDALPLIIPSVSFAVISFDFFQSILHLLQKYQALAVRCVCAIYKAFEVPKDYTLLFVRHLESFPPSTRLSIWGDMIAQAGLDKLQVIKKHITASTEMDENSKLSVLLCVSSAEYKVTKKETFTESMLVQSLHSRDFNVRASVLQYMCMKKKLTENDCNLLSGAIPFLFVYGDLQNENSQVVALETVLKKVPVDQQESFGRCLVTHFIPLISPLESGLRKFHVITCLKLIINYLPVTVRAEDVKTLIAGMFGSSQSLRNEMFGAVEMVLCKHKDLADIEGIQTIIEANKSSERFRESEGAAMLEALLNIVQMKDPIESMLNMIDIEKGIPPHFPLSVVYHYIQHSEKRQLNSTLLINRALPLLCDLLRSSLQYIGMEADFGAQVKVSVRKSWHAVRQSLNIIMRCFDLYATTIPVQIVETVGDTLFHFLMDSRQFSTVYHGHVAFRKVCSCCLAREDDSKKFPMKWCEKILSVGGLISSGDHRVSGGLVQTVVSLLDAEQSTHLGPIGRVFVETCLRLIEHPESDQQLTSALLMTETVLSDSQRQTTMRSYLPKFLIAILTASARSTEIEVKRSANKCFCTIILRQYLKRNELKSISPKEFFGGVDGIHEFFSEQLKRGQQEIVFILLRVIEMMIPFKDEELLSSITELRRSRNSRIRKTAARALLIVMPQENAESQVERLLMDIQGELEVNTLDGTVCAITSIADKWPNVRDYVVEKITDQAKTVIQTKAASFATIWALVRLCEHFHLVETLKSFSNLILHNEKLIAELPLGDELLSTVMSVSDSPQLLSIFQSGSRKLTKAVALKCVDKKLANEVMSVLIDRYLTEIDQSVVDSLGQVLLHQPFTPTATQQHLFQNLLLTTTDSAKLIELIRLSDSFQVDPAFVFSHFSYLSHFQEHPNDDIFPQLSTYALAHHSLLFPDFNQLTHWKLAIRLLSDDRASVREPCCQALLPHLNSASNLCEFDVLRTLYRALPSPALAALREDFTQDQRANSDDSHFRKEPPSFFFPPSLHISLMANHLPL